MGLQSSSCPTPWLKSRVTCSRLSRTVSGQLLKIFNNGDSTTSLSNLCSVTLSEKVFLDVQIKLAVFLFVPQFASCPLGTTEKSLDPFSLYPTCTVRCLYMFRRSPTEPSLLEDTWLQLSLYKRCFSP